VTTTVTCAADLLTDPMFVGFCNYWQENLRCPLPFSDWLREQGLDRQAEVALWAATMPNRQWYRDLGSSPIRCGGPTPRSNRKMNPDKWFWFAGDSPPMRCVDTDDICLCCNGKLPFELGLPHCTFAEAIVTLLDHLETPCPHH
jgi:hypothetical protein